MSPDEAKATVNRILADAGISMVAQHVPTTFDPKSKDWQHVAWRVTFKSKRGEFSTDYKQGIGHLSIYPKSGKLTISDIEDIQYALKTGKVHKHVGNSYLPSGKPIPAPDPANVVSSLILDAGAADYAKFEDWAADFGYESDSIKALRIFEACRNTALDLNRVFGAHVVEALREPCNEM
jgi:hypothetical protein